MFETIYKSLLQYGISGSGTLPQTVYNAEEFLVCRAKFDIFSWQKSRHARFRTGQTYFGEWLPLFRRYNLNPGFPLYAQRSDTYIISYEVL